MESKNVIAAISLSAAVIILYSLFFAPPPKEINNDQIQKEKFTESSDTPSIEKNDNFKKVSREDALKENDRVKFENDELNKILGREKRINLYKECLKFLKTRVELDLALFKDDIWSH